MRNDLKTLAALGWAGIIFGGFLLGTSVGGADRTISAALFYAIAVAAFSASAALTPSHRE